MMNLSIIVAMGRGREIGLGNALLWHLPEDMKFFRQTTTGHTVLMGRKTFLSIGRPLPKRRNLVLSRSGFVADGCEVFANIEAALQATAPHEEVFVIGGAEIYKQAIHLANRLLITQVDANFEADSFFPEFSAAHWQHIGTRAQAPDEANAYALRFEEYRRR